MRIALVTTYPPGKGSLNEYAYHFVRALRNKPEVTEVLVLVDELPDGQEYPADTELMVDGVAPLKIVPCWRFESWSNGPRILQAVRRLDPDAVLFNVQFASFGSGKVAAALGLTAPRLVKTAGYPTIVLLHNIMETVDLRSAGFAGNRAIEKVIRTSGNLVTRVVLGADLVALTIPKYVEIVAEKYQADNVLRAPHGSFEDDVTTPDFELPEGPRRLMTFGKFGTYKKVEPMLDAVRILQAAGHDGLEIIIAGTDSPNAAGYLDGVAKAYANMPNLTFTGYVEEEDVPRIFEDSTVVVFPYTSTTGSSGVLHQAGIYGKAVVLPAIGDFAEVIKEEGYDGEFFEPDDAASLAKAIENVLDNPERRQALGKQNFAAARGLPISDVVDWYLLHFETIMAERDRRIGTNQAFVRTS